MSKLFHFLRYDNSVPIVLGLIFLGAGGAFAATNPDAILSTQVKVLSVDNTYIASKDLSNWTPKAEITGVTEDSENYYIAYRFTTIDNKDYVWKDVVNEETMTVSKADLGQYRDLGVYVTEQLKQKIDRELARLKETQEIEKRQISQKMVATAYGGIVGKFLDDKTETLPGYTPVVTPPSSPEAVYTPTVAVHPEGETDTGTSTPATVATPAPANGPSIQILGENPARVVKNNIYVDLGAVASNSTNQNITVLVFLDGKKVDRVEIETSVLGSHTVMYQAADSTGTSTATRAVEVYDPSQPVGIPPAPQATSTAPASETPASTTSAATSAPSTPPATSTPPNPAPATSTPATSTPATATSTPATEQPSVSTPPATSTPASSTPTAPPPIVPDATSTAE